MLGVAYKKDIDDLRESPALDVIKLLQRKGGEVLFSDPYVGEMRLNHGSLTSQPLTPELLRGVHCVVVTTDHSSFDYRLVFEQAPLIVDTRNAFGARGMRSDKVIKL